MTTKTLKQLQTLVKDGEDTTIASLTQQALDEGLKPLDIITHLSSALHGIGERFSESEIFLSDMMLSAEAFNNAMVVLKPNLSKSDLTYTLGRIVIGTVEGDLHDLGKNLVTVLLQSAGFEVIDLGIDVPTRKFVQTAQEVNADIIAMSALMLSTLPSQKDVITLLQNMNIRNKFKIIVGGGPVTQEWAEEIGADGYAKDASQAVAIVKSLMNPNKRENI